MSARNSFTDSQIQGHAVIGGIGLHGASPWLVRKGVQSRAKYRIFCMERVVVRSAVVDIEDAAKDFSVKSTEFPCSRHRGSWARPAHAQVNFLASKARFRSLGVADETEVKFSSEVTSQVYSSTVVTPPEADKLRLAKIASKLARGAVHGKVGLARLLA